MIEFILFLAVMSFTPGPNTILALDSGQKIGLQRSLPYNAGIGVGTSIIFIIIAMIGELFVRNPQVIWFLKIIGTVYLLYLAYHVVIAQGVSDSQARSADFKTGVLLQFANPKVYLYMLTGITGFTVLQDMPVIKWLLMVGMGVAGTLLWTAAGASLKRFYNAHFRVVNLIVAVLLILSAVDLWL
jgi:threonine/homoserine/homoserine lactone efflux protein